MERIQNGGKLEKEVYLRGEGDHKRQLWEKQHCAGDETHTHTYCTHTLAHSALFTLIKKSHIYKPLPPAA